MNYISILNNQTIALSAIPELDYNSFFELNTGFITEHAERHCVNYFGYKTAEKIKLFCCIADDEKHEIYVSSCQVDNTTILTAFTSKLLCF